MMNNSEQGFIKLNQADANLLCQHLELTELAQQLLQNKQSSSDYLQQLIHHTLYSDAITVLAHALPKREATWWACLCARYALNYQPSANAAEIVNLTETWVYKPSEKNRQALIPFIEQMQIKTPAHWAALSAFWSGQSIAFNLEVIIPPTDGLNAKAVIATVFTSATTDVPENINLNYQRFLQQGIDIACGGDGRLN